MIRRAVAVVSGYWIYRTLIAAFVGAYDLDMAEPATPWAVLWAAAYAAAAAAASGYACALIAGHAALRAARLLGAALAAVIVLAIVQRLQQRLGPTWWLLVNLAAAPASVLGGALRERHRGWLARTRWRSPTLPG